MSEANVLKRLLNTSGQFRAWLFRFNVGKAWQGKRVYSLMGMPVPEGWVLLKDARVFKAGPPQGFSDTAGWTEVDIQPADVGRTVAVFTAYETKAKRGRLTPEQTNFLDAVRRSGGIAAEVREGEDIDNRLRNAARDWRG